MSPIAILKLLKAAKDIRDYVKKPNNLDQQGEMILDRISSMDEKLEDLDKRLKKIENKKASTQDAMYASIKKEIQKIKNDTKR